MCNREIYFQNKTKRLDIPYKTTHSYRYLPKQETTKRQDKNYSKTKKNVESENVDSSNKFKILEKIEIENSPQVHKHKGHKINKQTVQI